MILSGLTSFSQLVIKWHGTPIAHMDGPFRDNCRELVYRKMHHEHGRALHMIQTVVMLDPCSEAAPILHGFSPNVFIIVGQQILVTSLGPTATSPSLARR